MRAASSDWMPAANMVAMLPQNALNALLSNCLSAICFLFRP
jgi:hypothetical protein